MRLTPMRYKTYTWPHNPQIYTVEERNRIVVHPIPYGPCLFQELGGGYRILRGEGAFVGEDAYQQFQQLYAVFLARGPGQLSHPVWPSQRALFVSLKLTEQPLPDYVAYSFEFWEERGAMDLALTEYEGSDTALLGTGTTANRGYSGVYIVKKGDTLWGIAKRYGVALSALIAANPQFKNPNLIYPGNEVYIP